MFNNSKVAGVKVEKGGKTIAPLRVGKDGNLSHVGVFKRSDPIGWRRLYMHLWMQGKYELSVTSEYQERERIEEWILNALEVISTYERILERSRRAINPDVIDYEDVRRIMLKSGFLKDNTFLDFDPDANFVDQEDEWFYAHSKYAVFFKKPIDPLRPVDDLNFNGWWESVVDNVLDLGIEHGPGLLRPGNKRYLPNGIIKSVRWDRYTDSDKGIQPLFIGKNKYGLMDRPILGYGFFSTNNGLILRFELDAEKAAALVGESFTFHCTFENYAAFKDREQKNPVRVRYIYGFADTVITAASSGKYELVLGVTFNDIQLILEGLRERATLLYFDEMAVQREGLINQSLLEVSIASLLATSKTRITSINLLLLAKQQFLFFLPGVVGSKIFIRLPAGWHVVVNTSPDTNQETLSSIFVRKITERDEFGNPYVEVLRFSRKSNTASFIRDVRAETKIPGYGGDNPVAAIAAELDNARTTFSTNCPVLSKALLTMTPLRTIVESVSQLPEEDALAYGEVDFDPTDIFMDNEDYYALVCDELGIPIHPAIKTEVLELVFFLTGKYIYEHVSTVFTGTFFNKDNNLKDRTFGQFFLDSGKKVRLELVDYNNLPYDWRLSMAGPEPNEFGDWEQRHPDDMYTSTYFPWLHRVAMEIRDKFKARRDLVSPVDGNTRLFPFASEKLMLSCHSTGGMIIRGLQTIRNPLSYNLNDELESLIDKAFYLNVPFSGAPKALYVYVMGEMVETFKEHRMLPDNRMIPPNLPIVYVLMASEQYNPEWSWNNLEGMVKRFAKLGRYEVKGEFGGKPGVVDLRFKIPAYPKDPTDLDASVFLNENLTKMVDVFRELIGAPTNSESYIFHSGGQDTLDTMAAVIEKIENGHVTSPSFSGDGTVPTPSLISNLPWGNATLMLPTIPNELYGYIKRGPEWTNSPWKSAPKDFFGHAEATNHLWAWERIFRIMSGGTPIKTDKENIQWRDYLKIEAIDYDFCGTKEALGDLDQKIRNLYSSSPDHPEDS